MPPHSRDQTDFEPLVDVFQDGVRAAASSLHDCVDDLSATEAALLHGASPQRRLEIATGRKLARALLEALGFRDHALLRDRDRVPIWPRDVVGSISHKEGLCMVAVASSRDRAGLGIDVELDRAVKPGLERMICRPSELDWIAGDGPLEIGRRCRAVFSAKEAVYKAFFPTLRESWAFLDVEVSIDLSRGVFRAGLPASAGRREVPGRILRSQGWIVSGVELE